ncbi:MAG TPA: tetratricopeptide repeat protein [Chitinophagaceae bacterium]|nr:tetratricopeptide repeat protein [Chitinophagaceae bacterium]
MRKRLSILLSLVIVVGLPQTITAQPVNQNAIDSIQQLLHSGTDDAKKIRWLAQIADIFSDQGRYTESIRSLNKALDLAEATGDRTDEPKIYNSLGGIYCALGDQSKGLEYYYKALRISEKLGDKKAMASSYQYIGAIFYDQNDDSVALKHTLAAKQLNLEIGNKFGYAQNNNSIADIYLRKGQYSDALTIFRESLKIYQEPGAPEWGVPWSITSIGGAFECRGDSAMEKGNRSVAMAYYQEALKNYLDALAMYRANGIMGGYTEQHFYTGTIYIKLDKIPEAKKHLETSLKLAAEMGSKDMVAQNYLYLSKIDSLQGDYQQAFRHFKLSTLYRDSVFNSEQSRKINIYKTQYEIEKKEEEIKLLTAENRLSTAIAEKQKQQKLFAYAAILLVLGLGSYGFSRYRVRKKAEVEQVMLKDRLHISQGLHDDIGSTLSSISVYANVAQKLSEKNSKEELNDMLGKIKVTSSEMISEMNDIVWTIHPKNDSMEKILLRMESYAKPMLMTKNIVFKLEHDPLILAMDLEMEKRKNFYLVFKETVNNAFKYSGCSEIATRIFQSNGCMEMHIKDNGVGFDVEEEIGGDKLTLSGNGLRGMVMRAEVMKGDLQINSVTGSGTEVKLRIPIP